MTTSFYAELAAASHFSFLRGASAPAHLVRTAVGLGLEGLGLADRNTVAGVVRAYSALEELRTLDEDLEADDPQAGMKRAVAARARAFRLVTGARLIFCDGTADIITYPATRAGWGRLCRLLTTGNRRAKKGECHLALADLLADARDLLLIVLPGREEGTDLAPLLSRLTDAAPGAVWLAADMPFCGADRRRLAALKAWGRASGVPLLAVNDVLYATPEERDLQDILTCVREGTTIAEAGRRLMANAERHLKDPAEMTRLFRDAPEAVAESAAVLARIDFTLKELKYEYPEEPVPPGWTPQAWLEELTWRCAAVRYADGIPEKVEGLLKAELALIRQLEYAPYFLTIHDIVRFAESRGILCQGRGSAANSAVCYVLGITAVDPNDNDLLFARFISAERREPPDIDVDFEHERREEVIQHIYEKYGRHRAGIVATVIHYRPRSAIRDVGKALGLTEDVTARLSSTQWGSWGRDISDAHIREAGLDPSNSFIRRAVELAGRLMGAPRHLSQHVGGFVLARDRLDDTVPIGNAAMADRTFIEWDKDDIDALFEHERREEVIQHIYEKYGRHRAGIVATVIHYRPRSAIRDVGKALGLTEDVTARLSSTQWGSWGRDISDAHIREAGLDPSNPFIRRAVELAGRLMGAPRHLSQHVGGFVLARGRLDDTVPIGNAAMADRTFIEWDKDDIDVLGLMKVDVLALGMLTCIRKALDLMRDHEGIDWGLADVPREQQDVYAMLQRGDSIGVFQVESRAQINMLPRLKPKEFYDLVIQVAIVRPGPIQGDMVHPYLRRRNGLEAVDYPSPAPDFGDKDELRVVLGKTMGVPLFQEQAMKLAMVAACFSDKEANRLRRAMATFRNLGTIQEFESLMVERMVGRGYKRDFAQRCFEQIKGFGSYGFPESHAASFAKLVYISSYIKCRHPAAFACALLNAQPMGFYAPAQIVRDAREHGVEVRPIDVNFSHQDNTLERREDGTLALRLGFRQVDGFHADWGGRLAAARSESFASIEELARRARLPTRAVKLLADADAFRSMALDRRAALWHARRLPDDDALPLFAAADARELGVEEAVTLPRMARSEHIVADYQTVRLSLKGHPMGELRDHFRREDIFTCAETAALRDGAFARNAGVVLVRQRPGNGKAIFITIEDETGITNIVLWERTLERFRREVMGARLLLVEGRIQKSTEGVVHLMAQRLTDRTADLTLLSRVRQPRMEVARADEFAHPQHPRKHPRDVRVLPKSRDFH